MNLYTYDYTKLDWSGSVKNMCGRNIRLALGLSYSVGAHAYMYGKYVDKKSNPEIGDVAIVDRFNASYCSKTAPAWVSGHIAVVTEVTPTHVRLYDSAYNILVKKSTVEWGTGGYISVDKLKSDGKASKINFITTKTMGKYEKIFKDTIKTSTVYNDLEGAAKELGDVAYFVAIGLERVKTNK